MKVGGLFVASAALLSACGGALDPGETTSDTSARGIISGHRSGPSHHPAVGAFLVRATFDGTQYPYFFHCTGTLIAPDVVLTAAHCLELVQGFCGTKCYRLETWGHRFSLDDDVRALEGRDVLAASVASTTRLVQYPRFSFDRDPPEDIGLVFLDRPITGVEPIALPEAADLTRLTRGSTLTIVGYGLTSTTTNEAGVRFEAETPIVKVTSAELQVGGHAPLPRTCYGDSGGPSLLQVDGAEKIVGVTSRGWTLLNGGECARDDIHTRVDPYLGWIRQELAKACADGRRSTCPVSAPSAADGCSAVHGRGHGLDATGALCVLALLVFARGPRRRGRHGPRAGATSSPRRSGTW